MRSGPAVLIGAPAYAPVRELASCWQSRGIETVIVEYKWSGEPSLTDGTRILSSYEHSSRWTRWQLALLSQLLRHIETVIRLVEKKKRTKAMAAAHMRGVSPLTVPIIKGISISRFVRTLKPRFVYGFGVYGNGLATALCTGSPRVLLPIGQDIYEQANAYSSLSAIIGYSLRHVDLVLPDSVFAAKYVIDRFGMAPDRVQGLTWGVDRQMFYKADTERRRSICQKYGMPPSAMIFMNVRRFDPTWGCQTVLDAFIRFAAESPNCHFVLLGGEETEEYVSQARRRLVASGLESRFTITDGRIPLKDCAELMSVADVFTSVVPKIDMRSWSILQATAAGGAPILNDQQAYREMERLGFKTLFVNTDDTDSLVTAMHTYARDDGLRRSTVALNQRYIEDHEDFERQMTRLLELIQKVVQSH